jgi:bifunctional DNase/RNase
MKKKELKILGLSYSQSQIGSYVIVLSEKKGNRKIPLIIKQNEAQRIAVEIEGMKMPRPSSHDLIKSLIDSFEIDIQEVFIHSLLEGIFYTKIITSNGLEEIDIECSAGDALTIAAIHKCPIYTTVDILNSSGIVIDDDGSNPEELEDDFVSDEEADELFEKNRVISIDDLEHMMNEALKNEEYEIAAELRDKIKSLRDENN